MIWFILTTPWLLWIFYTAVMRLKQVRDAGKLTTAMKVFGYPVLILGLLLDFFVNVVFASIIFVEIPKEWTVSARLTRLSSGSGWRAKVANSIRVALLDEIDPAGIHHG